MSRRPSKPPVPPPASAQAPTVDSPEIPRREAVAAPAPRSDRPPRPFRVPADSSVIAVHPHLPTPSFLGGAGETEPPPEPAPGAPAVAPSLPPRLPAMRPGRPGSGPGASDPFGGADEMRTAEWAFEERLALEEEETGEESHVIGGRYRITEGLALGGMGAVFKVAHLHLGKTFALKIILTERASDPRMQQFFFREARVLSQLSHPNIVQVTDFGTDDRFGAFLVMEYLRGETLFDRLEREERLKIGLALQIGLQLAEALDYMHSRSLIHCDIKPENVFLTRETGGRAEGDGEAVKLIDFGLSRSMVRGGRLAAREVGGTPAYAAPEQLAGRAPQPSMDIYGVGVLLYAMITGWPPFSGTVEEILEAKRTREPMAPSERLGHRLDPALETLLVRCLARDPAVRPVSMGQLIAELRGLLSRMGYVVPESSLERSRPVTGKHATLDGGGAPVTLDRCPMPMFVLSPEGTIQVANPTFGQVLETPTEALVGRALAETRLGRIYPELAHDLAAARERGLAVLRRIDFAGAGVGQASVFLWLAPEVSANGAVTRFWGILMPV